MRLKTIRSTLFSLLNFILNFFGFSILRKESFDYLHCFPERIHDAILQNSRGVMHVGAHLAEERFKYASMNLNVIWVEGQKEYVKRIKSLIAAFPTQEVLELFLSDSTAENVPFYLTNNDSASSSLFRLTKNHGFKNLYVTDTIDVCTYRADTAFSAKEISEIDTLVLDVQGAELKVLKGFGDLLSSFEYLKIEVSTYPIYNGGTSYEEIKTFLLEKHFFPLWEPAVASHSDVIFTKIH